jgi:hypothetical protein
MWTQKWFKIELYPPGLLQCSGHNIFFKAEAMGVGVVIVVRIEATGLIARRRW